MPKAAIFEEVTRVDLLPFTVKPNPDVEGELIVGNEDASAFMSTIPDGIDVLQRLARNPNLKEVQAELREAHGEDVEIGDFLNIVSDSGLVRSTNGEHTLRPPANGIRFFPSIRERHLRWFYTWPVTVAVLAFCVWGIALMWNHPEVRPTPAAAFVTSSNTLSMLLVFATSLVLVFKHELGHLFTARAFGVQGRIGLARRVTYIVAITDVSAAWTLPRWQRILVYLGGPYTNLIVMAAASIATVYAAPWLALHPFVKSMLALVILLEWLGIAFQFLVYARTDFYYVLSDGLGASNLAEDGVKYMKNVWARARGRAVAAFPLPDSARERVALRTFLVMYIVGVTYAFYILGWSLLFPIRERVVAAGGNVYAGATGAASKLTMLDGIVFIGLMTFYYGPLLWLGARWLAYRLRALARRIKPRPVDPVPVA